MEIGSPFGGEKTKLPGILNVNFKLTDKGYELDSIATSNSVLKKLCTSNMDYLLSKDELANALQEDFKSAQIDLKAAIEEENLPIYEQFVFQADTFLTGLDSNFQVDSEQQINYFFRKYNYLFLDILPREIYFMFTSRFPI